jgi:uncharacterized protein
MFSLSKLLVLLAVIGAVWYGFKYLSRTQYQREVRAATRDRLDRGKRRGGAEPEASDMDACPTCKAYVPAKGASNCGRPDCPY